MDDGPVLRIIALFAADFTSIDGTDHRCDLQLKLNLSSRLPGLIFAVEHVKSCYTEIRATMKTNVTLKIDADLLREARILAAVEGSSISALLAARLEQAVRERKGYDQARRRAVARLRTGFELKWTPPRSRDELHER